MFSTVPFKTSIPKNYWVSLFCLRQACVISLLIRVKAYASSPFTSRQRPIISICWGHRDSRLLMASGPALYVVRVEHRVSSLQLLCQQAIASALREDKDVSKLSLPPRLCSYLSTAFIPTIKVQSSALPLLPPTQRGCRDREGGQETPSRGTEVTCLGGEGVWPHRILPRSSTHTSFLVSTGESPRVRDVSFLMTTAVSEPADHSLIQS